MKKMATSDANLTASGRGSTDVNGNHTVGHPSASTLPRHLQNFNTFQFVSQLVSATPPYLFNMNSPFPGNFFSDLLRRMAPRTGTPGLPLDANLQQHIRAALMTKGAHPPPAQTLPQAVMPPPPLDLASLASQHRGQQQQQPVPPSSEKGIKRSLFSDVSALSSSEEDSRTKRPRIDEPRLDERRDIPPEALSAQFMMQSPFLPSSLHSPDLLSPWSAAARSSLLRPQLPIPGHVPPQVPPTLDPYRLLLDLRLAGQLRTMAASQAFHHKDLPLLGHNNHNAVSALTGASSLGQPARESKNGKEDASTEPQQSNNTLRSGGGDARASAFHPPGQTNEGSADTSDEEGPERRSNSRNSSNSSSSGNKDGLGPKYIFKNLTEIYQTINVQQTKNGPSQSGCDDDDSSGEAVVEGGAKHDGGGVDEHLTKYGQDSIQQGSEDGENVVNGKEERKTDMEEGKKYSERQGKSGDSFGQSTTN